VCGNLATLVTMTDEAPVIEVTELHKRYRGHTAVHDVSFSVRRGEIFGLLGPNGAGKTTTVECVEGLRRPDGGRVSVLGRNPVTDGKRLRSLVGVQLQESQLPERITVIEALRLYASFYPNPADPEKLISDWGLIAKRDTTFAKLSGGQQQRLFIALALVGNPSIAVLDELTTGLDPRARLDTWELIEEIRAGGVTVLLVTHFMAEAERLCDRVAVIDGGRVVALDSPLGLVERMDAGQRLSFLPSAPLDDRLLSVLPEVHNVRRQGEQVLVEGDGNVVGAVMSVLARNNIVAERLRVERPNLDDAFLALLSGSRIGGGS
jgi:ABC-2 type transport system ATP-binding protein